MMKYSVRIFRKSDDTILCAASFPDYQEMMRYCQYVEDEAIALVYIEVEVKEYK